MVCCSNGLHTNVFIDSLLFGAVKTFDRFVIISPWKKVNWREKLVLPPSQKKFVSDMGKLRVCGGGFDVAGCFMLAQSTFPIRPARMRELA